MNSSTRVLGVDIGGSKTHGVLLDGDRPVAEARVGSANIVSVGAVEAARQLDALFAQLHPGDDVAAACVGAAGIDAAQDEQRLSELLHERLPGVPLLVVSDVRLVLAAAGLDTGAVVVAGTGSAAWGRNERGDEARAGGWGYLLGDDGAAYGLIRSALRHVLTRTDNGLPPDRLTTALLAEAGVDDAHALLGSFYATPSRRVWARRSRVVTALAEQGDAAAERLVAVAAHSTVGMILPVLTRLDLKGPVVLAGGLLVHEPAVQAAVRDGLARHGVHDVQVLTADPVTGALALARTLVVP